MLALLTLLACTGEEPILSGLAPPTPEVSPGLAPQVAPAEEIELAYSKPEGVSVDVAWLGGRPWDQVRDVVSEQLGDIQEVEPLDPRDGTRYVLDRGQVWVHEGLIYMVRVELSRPTRRSSALMQLGIPPQAGRYFELSREYRLRWEAGFERIRMGREASDSDMVVWVEAMRWNPRTNRGR